LSSRRSAYYYFVPEKKIVSTIQAQLELRGCGPIEGTVSSAGRTKASDNLFQVSNVDSGQNPLGAERRLH
jgi:hypothetical protein